MIATLAHERRKVDDLEQKSKDSVANRTLASVARRASSLPRGGDLWVGRGVVAGVVDRRNDGLDDAVPFAHEAPASHHSDADESHEVRAPAAF